MLPAVFDYQPNQDSVLQVDQDSYNNCNTDSYQQKYTDGHTVIQFSQSGPFYFISGNKHNCLKQEKIVIIVLADRSNRNNNQKNTSPPTGASSILINSITSFGAFTASSLYFLL